MSHTLPSPLGAATPPGSSSPGSSSPWDFPWALDHRSLALFRIGLGLIMLADLAIRAVDFNAMYVESGMIPQAVAEAHYASRGAGAVWSLHWLSTSPLWMALLFALAAVLAAMLLLGRQTRIAAVGSWLLLLSLQTRTPGLQNGGDRLLLVLLFWAIFLPLDRRFALDAPRNVDASRDVSVGGFALMLQISLLYWCTGLFKWNADWHSGAALHLVLGYESYGKPLGLWLRDLPGWHAAATRGTLGLELLGPLLLWIPWRHAAWRGIACFAFVGLHLGIEATMTVGLFSWISLAAWLAVIPTGAWELFGGTAPNSKAPSRSVAETPWWHLLGNVALSLGAAAALIYVVAWNISQFRTMPRPPTAVAAEERSLEEPPARQTHAWSGFCKGCMPKPLNRVGPWLGISQRWSMFATANRSIRWYAAKVRLEDGRLMDALTEEPFHSAKPALAADQFPNHRWRKLFSMLGRKRYRHLAEPIAAYLLRRWNDEHPQTPASGLELIEFSQRIEADRRGDRSDKILAGVGTLDRTEGTGNFQRLLDRLDSDAGF